MTSAGGLVPAADAVHAAASLLLSGPAGGVRAAAEVAAACGFADAVSFDMGGTSTDVCLVRDGAPDPTGERVIAGLPIRLPALDVHTIGAGGGSIAALDAGGALTVGPRSAGAVPGPVCYGRGGVEPTVTDADLVLGPHRRRRRARATSAASMSRPRAPRSTAPASRPKASCGSSTPRWSAAVRVVTVERGVDPRDLALVAFGGAGPLHACAIADALGMQAVIVPPRAGVCSAAGLLVRARRRGKSCRASAAIACPTRSSRSRRRPVPSSAPTRTSRPRSTAATWARATSSPCRPPTTFPPRTNDATGMCGPARPSRSSRCGPRASIAAPLRIADLPEVARARVVGPSVVAEPDCTVWIPDGWVAEPRALGAWVMERVMSLDPATLQVLISRFTGVADEMGAVLRRAAYSPNIKERADCSCALFAPDGTLLVQAEHIPVHLGSMPAAVRAAIDACGADVARRRSDRRQRSVRGRDTSERHHVRRAGVRRAAARRSGWAANRAHHADLGGMAPGSMPPDATEIYQEGLRIPPVRWTREVEAMLARRVAHARRTARRSRRAARCEPARRRAPPRAAHRARTCSPRSSTTASAGCAPRCRDARERHVQLRRRPRLDGWRRRAGAGAHRGAGRRARRRHHVRLHRYRRATRGLGERGRSRNRQRGCVCAAIGCRSRPCLPTAARSDPSASSRPRARSSPRNRRSRSAPATSRSANAWPTCAWARSRRRRRRGSARRRKGR